MERLVRQPRETRIEELLRMLEQFKIAIRVCRLELADFIERILDRAAVVEGAAIGEAEAIPRIQRHKRQIVFHPLSEQLEQLAEQEIRGDHGRPGVVAEAVALENLRATAAAPGSVEQSNVIPLRA